MSYLYVEKRQSSLFFKKMPQKSLWNSNIHIKTFSFGVSLLRKIYIFVLFLCSKGKKEILRGHQAPQNVDITHQAECCDSLGSNLSLSYETSILLYLKNLLVLIYIKIALGIMSLPLQIPKVHCPLASINVTYIINTL